LLGVPLKKYIKEFFGLTFVSCLIFPFSYKIKFWVFGIPFNLLEVLIFLSFIGIGIFELFGEEFETKEKESFFSKLFKVSLFILFCSLVFSFYISPEKRRALGIIKSWFVMPLIFGYLVRKFTYTKERLKDLIYSFGLGGILLSVVSLFGGLFIKDFWVEGRLKVFFESPNYISLFLVPVFSFFFAMLSLSVKTWNKNDKIFYSVVSFLSLATVVLTKSRAGIIVSIASIVLSLFISYIVSKSENENGDMTFGNALFVSVGLMVVTLSFFVLSLFNNQRYQNSDSVRILIWNESLLIAKEKLLTGVGLGNFQSFFYNRTKELTNFPEFVSPNALFPHNLYLTFLLESGVLGLISFLVIVFCCILVLFKSFFEIKYKLEHFSRYENVESKKESLIFFLLVNSSVLVSIASILLYGIFDTPIWKNDLSIQFAFLLSLSFVFDNFWIRFLE